MITVSNVLEVERYLDEVDAVIFDLDDTLYSEKEYVKSGYRKIAEWLGRPEMEERLWQVFTRGGRALDEALDEKDRAEALRIYRFQEPDIHLYSGVAEMLARIRTRKKVGIITDGRPEGQRAKLRALGLTVDHVIITDELGGVEYRKPCAVAFEEMKRVLDVPFERMVYIGDNTSKDFIAPTALGMQCIHVENKEGIYYGR